MQNGIVCISNCTRRRLRINTRNAEGDGFIPMDGLLNVFIPMDCLLNVFIPVDC